MPLKASLFIAPQCAPVLSSPVSPPPDGGQYYDPTAFCCFTMICEQLKGWEALHCAAVTLEVPFRRLIWERSRLRSPHPSKSLLALLSPQKWHWSVLNLCRNSDAGLAETLRLVAAKSSRNRRGFCAETETRRESIMLDASGFALVLLDFACFILGMYQ